MGGLADEEVAALSAAVVHFVFVFAQAGERQVEGGYRERRRRWWW